MSKILSLISIFFALTCFGQSRSPDITYGPLFADVQKSGIFSDYKTFPDCTPLKEPSMIVSMYALQKDVAGFDLKKFIHANFQLPDTTHAIFKTDTAVSIRKHIDSLWNVLTREGQNLDNSSLMSLPFKYVVPGGRFRELFYWDSYFIMLGLQISGRNDLLKNTLDDFSFLINTFGFIPNGNRTYFLSRSQPPFYALMVELMAEKYPNAYLEYLPYMEKEYKFWMDGANGIKKNNTGNKRVVKLNDGEILNRYWDDRPVPRPEAYGKDIELTQGIAPAEATIVYRHIRAACESGWDFSSRWNKNEVSNKTIHTTDIIPVDLNCLLYFLEQSLSKAYKLKGINKKADMYEVLAYKRKVAILKYCWSEDAGFFMDYDFVHKQNTPAYTLAGVFPLYFHIAKDPQADKVAHKLESSFLKDGGFVTTLAKSEYQWDDPNGWAPLQWMTVKGLLNYHKNDLAKNGADKWIKLNEKVFKNTGKMMEKYNVVEKNELTGGGEYLLQDGFGWTNGVYLKLKSIYP